MSEASHEASGPIKNWKQLLVVAVLAFVVPVFIIIAVVKLITGGMNASPDGPQMNEERIAARIKPVGEVNLVQATASTAERSGQEVYDAACSACHTAGLMNSPKPGDKAAWGPRIAQGEQTLVSHAINGIRTMPAKGGNPSLSDAEVARAVIWMANQSGANFKEPAPATSAAAPAAAAPAPTPAVPAAAPVAATPAPTPAPPATAARSGEQVYQQACAMCHGAGLAGAPKLGDAAGWKARIAQGKSVLHDHAIKGIRAMPAKGGNPSLPDAEVTAAVDYMLSSLE